MSYKVAATLHDIAMTLQVNAVRVELRVAFLYPFAALWAITGMHFGARMGLALVASVLASVALHKCGHAVAAALFGVPISGFGLCGKGAYLMRQQSSGATEVMIAAAGPALNLAAALLLWLFVLPTPTVSWAVLVNAILGLSNFLPLPGSDGRRLLTAVRGLCLSAATLR